MIIFCDFDGPIVDVSDRYYATYKMGLEETKEFYQTEGISLYIHILTKEQFWYMKQERIADTEIAMRSGLRGDQIEYFLGRVTEIVNEPFLLVKDHIQPGINWALGLLHSQGVKLVLVTLREQKQVKQILINYGLSRLFSDIYGSDNLTDAYENSALAKTALLKEAIAKYQDDNSWMIGDTEADIIAGEKMGINTIALTCGIRSKSYLKRFRPTEIKADLLSATHYLFRINQRCKL